MPPTVAIPAQRYGLRTRTAVTEKTAPTAPAAPPREENKFLLLLLAAFLIQLFSNAALLVPALGAVRPAQTIGGLALLIVICQTVAGGRRLLLAPPDGYLLLAFTVACAFTVVNAVWPNYAFEACLDLVKMVVIYFLIVNVAASEAPLRLLLWTMVACGLFPALGSLWNWTHGANVEGRAAWMGFFANPNEMAYCLVVLLPIAWALAQNANWMGRIVLAALAGLFLIPIYLSFSRGSLIGLAVVGLLIGLRQKNAIARAATVGLLAAGVLAGSMYWSRQAGFSDIQGDADFNERLTTYQVAWSMYSQSPVLGVGLNCSSVAWPLYAPSESLAHHKWLITHNTFIQAFSETGTAGGGLLLAFFATVLWRARKVRRSPQTPERLRELGKGLEISFCGFLVCGMSGGYVMSWFPYLLAAFIGALNAAALQGSKA